MRVADIIVDQIKTIDGWAFASWGAIDTVSLDNGFRFKSSGMVRRKGYVEVIYNPGSDLYDVSFVRVRKLERIVDKVVSDVFADDLVNVIDNLIL